MTNHYDNKKIWLKVSNSSPEAGIAAYFELIGYKVNWTSPDVETVSEVLEKIEVFGPDVILLQAGQPGFDAFELCREIKANRRLSFIPVILFGKENTIQSAVKAYRAMAQYYVALAGDEYAYLLNLLEKL